MKPLNVVSMMTWQEVAVGGVMSADGIRIRPNKEPTFIALTTCDQAAELFNVGYEAIHQDSTLLDYF